MTGGDIIKNLPQYDLDVLQNIERARQYQQLEGEKRHAGLGTGFGTVRAGKKFESKFTFHNVNENIF